MNNLDKDLTDLIIKCELQHYDKLYEKIKELKSKYWQLKKENTTCGYCNRRVPYNEAGLLCKMCREDFGHSLLEEL